MAAGIWMALVLSINTPHFLVRQEWDSTSGLPHSAVTSLVQTGDGFLWVGTPRGLVRFNGRDFNLHDTQSGTGLPCVNIKDLAALGQDGLWVATQSCGLFYKQGNQAFQKYALPELHIEKMVASHDGETLWLVTRAGRLYRIHKDTYQDYDVGDTLTRGGRPVLAMLEDRRDGSLWLAGTSGLHRFAEDRLKPVALPVKTDTFTLFQDSENHIWTGFSRIYKQTESGWQRVKLQKFPRSIRITAMAQKETILASSSRVGLLAWEPNKGLRGFLSVPSEQNPGPSDNLLVDREGNIWRGSPTQGLSRWRRGNVHFQTESCPSGVCHTWSLLTRRNGDVWVGGQDGRLSIYGAYRALSQPEALDQGLKKIGAGLTTLYELDNGLIMVGTRGRGAWRWDGQSFESIPQPKDGYDPVVRSFLQKRDGEVWMAPGFGGLMRLDDKGEFERIGAQRGVAEETLYTLTEDRKGRIWACTISNGLVCWEGDALTRYKEADGLPGELTSCLFEDSEGRIWVGTTDGLAVYHEGRFYSMGYREGLPDESVMALNQDGEGRLWLSLSGSLAHANPAQLAAFLIGQEEVHGLQAMPADAGQYFFSGNTAGGTPSTRDLEGRVWFASERGAAVVDSSMLTVNEVLIKPKLDYVLLDQQRYPEIPAEIAAGVKRMVFHFNGPCLTNGDAATFRYKLAGYETEWNLVDDRREAAYTNLPPGNYVFRVMAANNDGLWSAQSLALSFLVLPPSWWTPLAKVVYVFLGLCLLYLTFSIQTSRGRARERLLEGLVAKRTEGLLQAQGHLLENAHRAGVAENATHIMHNVGNAVNRLNTSTSLLRERLEKSNWPRRLARLLSLFDQGEHPVTLALMNAPKGKELIEGLRRVDKGLQKELEAADTELIGMSQSLEQVRRQLLEQQQHVQALDMTENGDVTKLIHELLAAEHDIFTIHDMEVILSIPEDLPDVPFHRPRMKHLFLRLVVNACEARQDNRGRLKISAEARDNELVISFADDGSGIPQDVLAKVLHQGFSTKPGSAGLGLHYCATVMEQINGRIQVLSEGPGRGTEVRLYFPLVQESFSEEKG